MAGPAKRSNQARLLPTTDAWRVGLDDAESGNPRQERVLRERLHSLVEQGQHDLPPAAAVAQEVAELSRRSNSSAAALAAVVERDPFIAGRVLRLANSSYYGFPRPAETLQQAIARIGVGALRTLLYSLGVKSVMEGVRHFRLHVGAVWRHSLATSVAAGLLARELGSDFGRDAAALAGLLHDAGIAVLIRAADDAVDSYSRDSRSPVAWFNGVVWPLHAEASRILAVDWKLGPALEDVLAFHHRPEDAHEAPELTTLVNAADSLAGAALLGRQARKRAEVAENVARTLCVSIAGVESLLAALPEKVDALASGHAG